MSRVFSRSAMVLTLVFASACPADDTSDETGVEPDFPEDYESTYVEVRNCRGSGDHDLNNIRILASPTALEPYQGRVEPFPVDAIVLKEEYDFGDMTCSGPIKQWTVMRRLADKDSPDTLDWAWQTVDLQRQVNEDATRCVNCHQGCGASPEGYDGTCAMP